jgi:hypothetical protein
MITPAGGSGHKFTGILNRLFDENGAENHSTVISFLFLVLHKVRPIGNWGLEKCNQSK